jgi:hypothetical protein
MDFACRSGCKTTGTKKNPPPRICETHGETYVYTKALRGSGLSRNPEGSTTDKPSRRRRRSTLKRGKSFPASDAQRAKVADMPCVSCGKVASAYLAIDPAHVWPRGKGGCDSPDCVLPLCRLIATGEGCHRLFDEGRLELVERLADSEACQVEQAHPILVHGVSPVELVRRLSGGAYEFVRAEDGAR